MIQLYLSTVHICCLILSNVLVQYPFQVFGYHTTWGAFTYPVIFIVTDLTTRMISARVARQVIFYSMLPGLVISYGIASYLEGARIYHLGDFFMHHPMPLRIAVACFTAYVIGQLMDIFVFQRYQNTSSWWLAPMVSSTVGNIIDTLLFFSIAFYHCSNALLSQKWPEIAAIDLGFKIMMSLFIFVPMYGVILGKSINFLQGKQHDVFLKG